VCSHCSELHNKLWSKNDKPCNELLHRNSNMDLKMHVCIFAKTFCTFAKTLRSPASLGILRWGDASGQKLEVGELRFPAFSPFPRVLLHFNHWLCLVLSSSKWLVEKAGCFAPGKEIGQNDLQCVEWDTKTYWAQVNLTAVYSNPTVACQMYVSDTWLMSVTNVLQSHRRKATSSKSLRRQHRSTSTERVVTWQQEAENVLQMIVDSPDSVPFRNVVNIDDFPVCHVLPAFKSAISPSSLLTVWQLW